MTGHLAQKCKYEGLNGPKTFYQTSVCMSMQHLFSTRTLPQGDAQKEPITCSYGFAAGLMSILPMHFTTSLFPPSLPISRMLNNCSQYRLLVRKKTIMAPKEDLCASIRRSQQCRVQHGISISSRARLHQKIQSDDDC